MSDDAKEFDKFHIPEINAFRHIRRVIKSCKTLDQCDHAFVWAMKYKPLTLLHPSVAQNIFYLASEQLEIIWSKKHD